jgi:hypothetical protein
MNLCSIGIHDYEVLDERLKVRQALHLRLEELGFKRKEGRHSIPVWKRDDGIAIGEWGFYDDWKVSYCIPSSTDAKVCLKCGKIKLTYKMEKCLSKLDYIIAELVKEKKRERLAKEMRSQCL